MPNTFDNGSLSRLVEIRPTKETKAVRAREAAQANVSGQAQKVADTRNERQGEPLLEDPTDVKMLESPHVRASIEVDAFSAARGSINATNIREEAGPEGLYDHRESSMEPTFEHQEVANTVQGRKTDTTTLASIDETEEQSASDAATSVAKIKLEEPNNADTDKGSPRHWGTIPSSPALMLQPMQTDDWDS